MRLSKKVLIAIALFALMISSFTYSALGSAQTPRNQTVWGTGYGTWGLRLNPYDGSPQWAVDLCMNLFLHLMAYFKP
jgi:hypothetical protein